MDAIDLDKRTGHRLIDKNHVQMMTLISSLGDYWRTSPPMEDFQARAQSFLKSLDRHFKYEEAALRVAGFQGLEEHERSHNNIIQALQGLVIKPFDSHGAYHFMNEMQAAIFEHELVEDQMFWNSFEHLRNYENTPFQWSDDLASGNKMVDAHHRGLIEHLGRMDLRVQDGEGVEYFPSELEQLYFYCSRHFKEEEDLFTSLPADRANDHKKSHVSHLESLQALQMDLKDQHIKPGEALSYLRSWLFDHIRTYDIPDSR